MTVEALIVPLYYVRDELDIGHSAVSTLTPEDYDAMHAFADRAEKAVTVLLAYIVDESAAGRYTVRSLGPAKPHKTTKMLRAIRDNAKVYVDAFGPLAGIAPKTMKE